MVTKNFVTKQNAYFSFTVTFKEEVTLSDLLFAFKKNINDEEPVLQKSLEAGEIVSVDTNKYRIAIADDETSKLEPLNYIWGLVAVIGGNNIPLAEGKLLVTKMIPEVTNE